MSKLAHYHANPQVFTGSSKVKYHGKDDSGPYILLENTLFYPQGGGQPFDQGLIEVDGASIAVSAVRMRENEIRHYVDVFSDITGKEVVMHVDGVKRTLHSKLHTAGHVVSHIVETLYQGVRAVKGHHFPGECYVEFTSEHKLDLERIQTEMERLIAEDLPVTSIYVPGSELTLICPDLSYKVPQNELMRLVRMGSFPYQPCCGTHVERLSELKGVKVSKQKLKGKTLKISYE